MKDLVFMMKLMKLGQEINDLVKDYIATTDEVAKNLILVNANDLKRTYATKTVTEDFPIEAYDTMFKVKEAKETNKHYIELYIDEM